MSSIIRTIDVGISTMVQNFFTVLLLIAGLAVLAIAIGPAFELTSLVTGAASSAQGLVGASSTRSLTGG